LEDYDYVSNFEAYIDGSCNGSQHLSALTRDDISAPFVNLLPSELPGDLYKYIAEHVWKELQEKYDEFSMYEKEMCEKFVDTIIDLKKQIAESEPSSDHRKELVEIIKMEKNLNPILMERSCLTYWLRVVDLKERRKICKRNVMSLPYGATPYGLGEQQISDAKKHGIDLLKYMEHKWGSFLGRVVYDDCETSLKRPMRLLKIFENAGKKAESEGRFLSWNVPITHFPVVQNYIEGKVKKVWVVTAHIKSL
jgi:DNA-directed RNA polymerase